MHGTIIRLVDDNLELLEMPSQLIEIYGYATLQAQTASAPSIS